jgi:hypothetical protein
MSYRAQQRITLETDYAVRYMCVHNVCLEVSDRVEEGNRKVARYTGREMNCPSEVFVPKFGFHSQRQYKPCGLFWVQM